MLTFVTSEGYKLDKDYICMKNNLYGNILPDQSLCYFIPSSAKQRYLYWFNKYLYVNS